MVAFIFFSLLFISLVHSSSIYFDSNVTHCNKPAGCLWNDASIWIGGIIPKVNDDIYIIDSRPDIKILCNGTTTNNQLFNLLVLSGVTLEVSHEESLNVVELQLQNATLEISNFYTEFICLFNVSVSQNSTININSGAVFEQAR